MKKKNILLLTFLLICSLQTWAQNDNNWAIGLKVGEPLGVNLRKYFSYGERAFDLNVGSYGFLYGANRNYRKKKIYESAGVMIQGLYHWHNTMGKKENLHYYYGFGGQINSRNRPPEVGVRDAFRVVSFGSAANTGLEYRIPENDLGVFLDAGGYLEIAPKPFFLNAQINLGLRLNLVK
jgi:hypothetical protein